MDIWKKIGINRYEASEDGQVRNGKTGKVLKQTINRRGYKRVYLHVNGWHKHYFVHRLIYETFIGKIPDGMVIDHVDGNPQNNRLDNLRCVTQKENVHNPITFSRLLEGAKKRSQNPDWKRNHAEAVKKSNGKPVLQMKDYKTLELINSWDCQADASRELGINKRSISACCTGNRKSAGGYYWKNVP